jgi:hypothetical protein
MLEALVLFVSRFDSDISCSIAWEDIHTNITIPSCLTRYKIQKMAAAPIVFDIILEAMPTLGGKGGA